METSLLVVRGRVEENWIDGYGHMNMAMYVLACDRASGNFWDAVNDGLDQRQRGGAEFAVVEAHVNYLRELRLGERYAITTQLLDADHKRFRLFHAVYREGGDTPVATNEIMALGFDLEKRALMHFNARVARRLAEMLELHARLPRPVLAGRAIGDPPPSAA